MFTRTVEVTPKSGKARELASTINEKVLLRPFWYRRQNPIRSWH